MPPTDEYVSLQRRRVSGVNARPSRPADWAGVLREARAWLDRFAAARAALDDRMALLAQVAQLARKPRAQWEPALAAMPLARANVAVALLLLVEARPEVAKRVWLAAERYTAACAAMDEAARALAGAADAPPEARPGLLAALDPARLKVRCYLLTTYDLQFAEDPVLAQMFPRRDRTAEAAAPGPVAAPAAPGAANGFLRRLAERLGVEVPPP